MYKIDNKYQKAKIKNLKYKLYFQKYNIKEKKKKKRKKERKNELTNETNKKTPPTKKTKAIRIIENNN